MFTKNDVYLNHHHPERKYIRLLTRWDLSEQDFRRGPSHSVALVGLDTRRVYTMSDRCESEVGDTSVPIPIYENIRLEKRQQLVRLIPFPRDVKRTPFKSPCNI